MKPFSHHLERWQKEPEGWRQHRALLLASGITLCLFVLWLGSFRLSASLRAPAGTANLASVAVTKETAKSEEAPGIIERIKAGWQAIIK